MNKRRVMGLAGLVALCAFNVGAQAGDPAQVDRGRYLVTIAGCNDCHTPGFMEKNLAVPEKDWLRGSAVGFQGPWGTTYAANLRRVLAGLTAAQWVEYARLQRRPPMPSYALQRMSSDDLQAIYAYVRSLGDPGDAAPAYVPPGGVVTTPYLVMVPQGAEQAAANAR